MYEITNKYIEQGAQIRPWVFKHILEDIYLYAHLF